MSRTGRIAAAKYAETLPAFDSLAEAQRVLYAFRDERLALLRRLADASTGFEPDYRPESLKALERWYFDLAESEGFSTLGIRSDTFQECVAMYFFETAVRNADVQWTVEEYAFEPGRYEIGVTRALLRMFGRRRQPRAIEQQNKRKQSIWREYQQYFGEGHAAN